MSLATIIRLEFAYPGVGILAGDSIQYLSIATAHGVIMVFFMIMPAIFGAFGNFLLPTQLGVHDVAFPRLNSAAFWFLPGGLIMLCQLVCVDRRYQRMNCFNIRELQGILKRKFFTDLVNSNDHRDLFDKSIIGLRFKNNNQLNINHDMSLFYNFGTTNSAKTKYTFFSNNYVNSASLSKTKYALNDFFIRVSEYVIETINMLLTLNISNMYINFDGFKVLSFKMFTNSTSNIVSTIKELFTIILSITPVTLLTLTNLPKLVNEFVVINFTINFYNANGVIGSQLKVLTDSSTQDNTLFTSENITNVDSLQTFNSSMSEISTSLRFTRFNNPLISYDYKCGNYLGI
jgi:hypothetical protein